MLRAKHDAGRASLAWRSSCLPPGASGRTGSQQSPHSDTIRSNGARTDVRRGMVVRAMAESW